MVLDLYAHDQILNSTARLQWEKIGIRHLHGIVVPLFSLHSASSCGIGEYTDLPLLFDWCRDIGLDVIQLLPLNDTGLDSSPYGALSAFALSPVHLGLKALPHAENPPQLPFTQRLQYNAIRQAKDDFLRRYYQDHGPVMMASTSFEEFKRQNAFWLTDYSIFKALKVKQGWQSWEQWPQHLKDPSRDLYAILPNETWEEAKFHQFVQYLCFQQFKEVKARADAAGVLIKGDIPILINRESADVWRHRTLFNLDYAAGSPPDMYAKEGQKWGFPLYNWQEMQAHNYRWWIERLAFASQVYHLYRLDHVVGFYRIWAVPLSKKSKEGFFMPSDENLWIPQGDAIMQMMLKHSSMLPIAEDLGTVPPAVRKNLRDLGICGTRVMRWERRWETDKGFIDIKDYQPLSMTTVSTHDSETLQQWWHNQPEEAHLFANSVGWHYGSELTFDQRYGLLQMSHHSGSLFHINLLQEYFALIPSLVWPQPEDERINTPGVVSDQNWTYRFRPSVEEIVSHPQLKQLMQRLISSSILAE